MATQQELREKGQTLGQTQLRKATMTSQLNKRVQEQYKRNIENQKENIANEIEEREKEIKRLNLLISKAHRLSKAEKIEKKARLKGELELYKKAEKLVKEGKLVQIDDKIARKYALATIEYQKARYRVRKIKAKQRRKEEIRKAIEKKYNVGFQEAQKIRDYGFEAVTKGMTEKQKIDYYNKHNIEYSITQNLPAKEIRPNNNSYIYSKPVNMSSLKWYKKLGVMAQVVPAPTKIVVHEASGLEREATQKEKEYYKKQLELRQQKQQPSSFIGGIKQQYKQGGTPVTGTLNVLGYILGKAEKGKIELEKKGLIPKSAIGKILPQPEELRIKRAELTGKVGPYFIPAVGEALLLSHGVLLGKQKLEGALSESPKLSIETREKLKASSPVYQRAKAKEKEFIEMGVNKSLAKTLAFLPMDIQIGAGLVAGQSYLARHPIITKEKPIVKTYLVKEKVNVGEGLTKSRYSILQKTSQNVVTEKRGLIVFGNRFSTKTYNSLYKLSTIGNVVEKKGNVYGLLKGQREGAKMFKIYELRGTATRIPKEQLSKLSKIQREPFKYISKTNEGVYSLGEVRLKELGKFKFLSKGKYKFIPKEELGRTTTTAMVGGKTEPLTSLGIKYKDLSIVKKINKDNLFFTEVYGKKLGEGMPRAGGKFKELNILTKVEHISKTPEIKFIPKPNMKYYKTPEISYPKPTFLKSSVYPNEQISYSLMKTENALKTSSKSALALGGAGVLIPKARFSIPTTITTKINLLGLSGLIKNAKESTIQKVSVIQKPITKTIQKVSVIQKPITKSSFLLKTIPKLITKNPIKTPTPRPSFYANPPPSSSNGISKALKKIRQMKKEKFEVFVKKLGKNIKLGEFETLGKAKKRLVKELRTTLRAGGYISKNKKPIKAKSLKLFGFEFRPSRKNPYKIIEKKRRRLKKAGTEVKEIMSFWKTKKPSRFKL